MTTQAMQHALWTRRVPIRYEADVAVLGAGIAGVTAAIAAARTGAKVILIEKFAVTGGNATVGGVKGFCGETAGQGEVFDYIISCLEQFKAIAPYVPYPTGGRHFNHELLSVILQEILLKEKVKLLLHTQFIDVSVSDEGTIKECIISGKSGPEALRAKQFIDCTGEAQVAHMCGFATMKGRASDQVQLPMSIYFFVRDLGEDSRVDPIPEGWFEQIRENKELPMISKEHNGPGNYSFKVKVPLFDATDTERMSAAEVQARRKIMAILDYYQTTENKNWMLSYISPQIGIREGRRVIGDYILTVDDLRRGCQFDDAIARGVYYLDAHKPDDDKRTYILDKSVLRVPPYQIPLRCLIAKDGRNLITAGRSLSADQLALSSARVMTTCAMTGQAAGILAAESALANRNPRDMDPLKIRKMVEARGAILEV